MDILEQYEANKLDGTYSEEEIEILEELVENFGEVILAYLDEVRCEVWQLEDQFEENHMGEFNSWGSFAEQLLQDCGDLADVPEWIRNHIDFESLGDELSYDYFELDGHFFRR